MNRDDGLPVTTVTNTETRREALAREVNGYLRSLEDEFGGTWMATTAQMMSALGYVTERGDVIMPAQATVVAVVPAVPVLAVPVPAVAASSGQEISAETPQQAFPPLLMGSTLTMPSGSEELPQPQPNEPVVTIATPAQPINRDDVDQIVEEFEQMHPSP